MAWRFNAQLNSMSAFTALLFPFSLFLLVPTTHAQTLLTTASAPIRSAPLECGQNFKCLVNAAKKCMPGRATLATTIDVQGLTFKRTDRYEIKGMESGQCILARKILKEDVSYAPKFVTQMKQEGASVAQIAAQLREDNKVSDQHEKLEGVCSTTDPKALREWLYFQYLSRRIGMETRPPLTGIDLKLLRDVRCEGPAFKIKPLSTPRS